MTFGRIVHTIYSSFLLLFLCHRWWIWWGRDPSSKLIVRPRLWPIIREQPNSRIELIRTIDPLKEKAVARIQWIIPLAYVECSTGRLGMPRLLHLCQLIARFTTTEWNWKGRRDWGILITLGWVLSTTKQLVPGIAHCHVHCRYINSIAMWNKKNLWKQKQNNYGNKVYTN